MCNADSDLNSVPTQECFNQHPLNRAPGDDVNSPIDPDYPGRYYVDPPCRGNGSSPEVFQKRPPLSMGGYNMRMTYVLPDIECDHCVMQMVYREFFFCSLVVVT